MGSGTSKLNRKQRCYNRAVEVIERAREMSQQNLTPLPPYVDVDVDDITIEQDTYNHDTRVAKVIDNGQSYDGIYRTKYS